MGSVQIKRSICTFCAGNCGVLVHVKDGRPVKIEGNKEHPISRGFICQRIQVRYQVALPPGTADVSAEKSRRER